MVTERQDQFYSQIHALHQEKFSWLYKVKHETWYRYEPSIQRSQHILRLFPYQGFEQNLVHWQIYCQPNPEFWYWQCDRFGNREYCFELFEAFQELRWVSDFEVLCHPPAWWDCLKKYQQRRLSSQEKLQWQSHLITEALTRTFRHELMDYALTYVSDSIEHPLDCVIALTRAIYRDFSYSPGSTHFHSSTEEFFKQKAGVCQDFSQLLILLLRLLDIPAAYQTGYIAQDLASPGEEATHAWVLAYLPQLGWTAWDPTHGQWADQRYIRLCHGLSACDAAPTEGYLKSQFQSENLEVRVSVLTQGVRPYAF